MLEVYDVRGRRVQARSLGSLGAGRQSVQWDGCDAAGASLAAGVYLLRLNSAGGASAAVKAVFVK